MNGEVLVRNPERWSPSKYVIRRGRLIGSRDPRELAVGSRLIADLTAGIYERNLPLHVKGRLLDLGCGKAPLYESYKGLVSESICVDWANTIHRNEHLDVECDISQPLPFCDSRFDTVILSDVLEHVATPEALCREIARILAPGGKLIMNVPFFYSLHEEPHDYYRYTHHALRRLVESAGLKIITLQATGGSPELLADILAKHFQRVPMLGNPAAAFVQWVTLRFGHTRCGRALSRYTARAFPFGYFLVAAAQGA
jgi:SAM-dependent methyltransferase